MKGEGGSRGVSIEEYSRKCGGKRDATIVYNLYYLP